MLTVWERLSVEAYLCCVFECILYKRSYLRRKVYEFKISKHYYILILKWSRDCLLYTKKETDCQQTLSKTTSAAHWRGKLVLEST